MGLAWPAHVEVATGNLQDPASINPLKRLYSQAFQALCYGLATLTLATALISRWALRIRRSAR